MTCHDKAIMNRVVKKIVEIDGGELRTYGGNYDFYEHARELEAARREAAYARQQAMLAKEIALRRALQDARREGRAGAEPDQEARQDREDRRAAPLRREDVRVPHAAALAATTSCGSTRCRRRYGARVVHDELTLTVRRKERWAVMGENGAGKSTLLKMIAGALAPDAGARRDRRVASRWATTRST